MEEWHIPELVLQATNAGVRGPGNEAGRSTCGLPFRNDVNLIMLSS